MDTNIENKAVQKCCFFRDKKHNKIFRSVHCTLNCVSGQKFKFCPDKFLKMDANIGNKPRLKTNFPL